MALASQSQRSGSRGGPGRGRRGGRLKIMAVIFLAAVGYFTWKFFFAPAPTVSPDTQPPVAAVEPETIPAGPVAGSQTTGTTVQTQPVDPTPPAVKGGTETVAAAVAPAGPPQTSDDVARKIAGARQMIQEQQLVGGRKLLNEAMHSGKISPEDAEVVRREIVEINKQLIFTRMILKDDPYVDRYRMQAGEFLGQVGPKFDVPWEFIAQINGLNPNRVPAGSELKVVKGPFHAVVHKRAFRVDLYLQDLYVMSLPVGLGEFDSTPVGPFKVRNKLSNPAWVNPRTNEQFEPDNPKNPIGEHWIGVIGTAPDTVPITGYGIHGTIDPDSVGHQKSMGCVRLRARDIEQIYNMLIPEKSTLQIVEY